MSRAYYGGWVRTDDAHPRWFEQQPPAIQAALARGRSFRVARTDGRSVTLEVPGVPAGVAVYPDDLRADEPRLNGHPERPSFREVTHVGGAELGSVKWAGARRVLASEDNLEMGPARLDASRHVAARAAWWRSDYGIVSVVWNHAGQQLLSELRAAPRAGPMVVWGASAWPSTLLVWRVAHLWAKTHRVDRPWLAQPGEDWRRLSRDLPNAFSILSAHDAMPMFAAAREMTRRQMAEYVRGWKAWCAPTPRLLEQHRARNATSPDFLARVPFRATHLLPRKERHRLSLSFLDHALLSGLSTTEFRSAMNLVQQRRSNRIMDVVNELNDTLILARLLAWARQRPQAVELRFLELKAWEFHTAIFRLTALGQRIVDEGLWSIDEAPPFALGGWAAHDPAHPWAWEGTPRDWRFVALDAERRLEPKPRARGFGLHASPNGL